MVTTVAARARHLRDPEMPKKTMVYRGMTTAATRHALCSLSDRELIAETHRLAEYERHATADVIAALMEVEERRLYLGEGHPSLFNYCTQRLHFSEHAAYGRIEAARVAQRFPAILDLLADGSLTLTAVDLLKPHLTPENHIELLASARHKSKRDVQQLVASIRPLPAVPSSVRKVPERTVPASTLVPSSNSSPKPESVPDTRLEASPPSAVAFHPPTPVRPAVIVPLAPERYKVQITISREGHDNLRRAQDLLRHCVPNGDPAAVVERALALLVEDLERKKTAAAKRPRPSATGAAGSRHVPAAVKREVWARDEGRCAFVGGAGRCTERGFLELHHLVPFADGGATDAGNLQLRCRAHNVYEAEQWFGPLVVRERQPDYQTTVRRHRSAIDATRSGPSCWYPVPHGRPLRDRVDRIDVEPDDWLHESIARL